jgi:hypothetical protein
LRLISLIIAALLAVTAGIVVISAPQAVVSGDRTLLPSVVGGQVHGSHTNADSEHGVRPPAHDHIFAKKDCGDPASEGHHGSEADCWGTSACHAVQALAAPMLHAPYASATVLALIRDNQVGSVVPGGLDRPPRTT